YRRNIRSIMVLNQVHNVRTIFVGQVLNRAKLTADKAYGWLPLVKDKDVPAVMRFFNDALLDEATRLQAPAVVLDMNDFSDADFIDNGHFSEAGAVKFAGKITPRVAAACGDR